MIRQRGTVGRLCHNMRFWLRPKTVPCLRGSVRKNNVEQTHVVGRSPDRPTFRDSPAWHGREAVPQHEMESRPPTVANSSRDDFWYLVAFAVFAFEELVRHCGIAADELFLLGIDRQKRTQLEA